MTETEPEPRHSWKERETLHALQRLANARERLASLEEQAEAHPDPLAHADPAGRARIAELHDEIELLRPKAKGRFGGSHARSRIEQLEGDLRLVLERVGFAGYDDYIAALDGSSGEVRAMVDPMMLDFARREFADAQRDFLEITSLEMPDVVEEPELDEADDAVDVLTDDEDADLLGYTAGPAAS